MEQIRQLEKLNLRLKVIKNGTSAIVNIENILNNGRLTPNEFNSLNIARENILNELQKLEEFKEDKVEQFAYIGNPNYNFAIQDSNQFN